MKKFHQLSATAILTLALAGSAFAGDIHTDHTSSVAGDIHTDNTSSIAGDIDGDDTDSTISGDRTIALQQTVFSVLRTLGLM